MKILLLAPHPFYQERGTPIAVDLLLKSLSSSGHQIDLITFHEGKDRYYDSVKTHRIKPFGKVADIRPGFSAKKIYSDVFVFFKFLTLLIRNRYDVVHAVEESAFMAMLVCPIFRTPFIYDMDSSMATQVIDKFRFVRKAEALLRALESLPARAAKVVVPCCDALERDVSTYRDPRKKPTVVLKDISLLDKSSSIPSSGINLKERIGESPETCGRILMYIGNLESYQGIDLLLEGFTKATHTSERLSLVIVGGEIEDIEKYRNKSIHLGVENKVYFLGKQPVSDLYALMRQADILMSPRTQGVNTPMKVYSYLDSNIPVLATRLPTHTQVMTDEHACLVEASAAGIAEGIEHLVKNPELCQKLAKNAQDLIEAEHSFCAFHKKVQQIYTLI